MKSGLVGSAKPVAALIVLLLAAMAAPAASPVVSSVTAAQRPGTKLVDIRYNLSDSDNSSLDVSVAVSTNDGVTYDLAAPSLSDGGSTHSIGSGVSPGNNRWIVWNAGADWSGNFSSLVKFRVTANDMALIPAGSFVMGATTNMGHESNTRETPQHTVYVSAFYMDRYEVTKALWDDVATWAATHGYDLAATNASGKAASHPVHYVSWYECVKWSNARSEQAGLTPCYTVSGSTYKTGNNSNVVCNWSASGFRLPTEAEWEKAARGGSANHRFPWTDTDTIQHARANYYSSSIYAYDTSLTRGYHPAYSNAPTPSTSPVGYFAPNGYGLYDMTGNVWEWCWDWYSESYYSSSPGTDPRGASSGSHRVLRSGGWLYTASNVRVAYRLYLYPTNENYSNGFRCCRGL